MVCIDFGRKFQAERTVGKKHSMAARSLPGHGKWCSVTDLRDEYTAEPERKLGSDVENSRSSLFPLRVEGGPAWWLRWLKP